ncbi:MAG: LuxR C-terminal-related transcriptional regulator [Actinobacteria bacterium]|nr:LuxR C-terminal-related transcriptional regulator [Actinomycetota bacterium]
MATTKVSKRIRTLYLSERERDVARLVAAGLSNEAIADRLRVSPRTVQTHVANARKKSGCANRTELGVLAVREGLISPHGDTEASAAAQTSDRFAEGP